MAGLIIEQEDLLDGQVEVFRDIVGQPQPGVVFALFQTAVSIRLQKVPIDDQESRPALRPGAVRASSVGNDIGHSLGHDGLFPALLLVDEFPFEAIHDVALLTPVVGQVTSGILDDTDPQPG
jgi:hypothetical protein